MQRWASAHFRVIRINRWAVAAALVLILGLLLVPRATHHRQTNLPTSPQAVIQSGVTLFGRDFSGKSEAEARAMLAEMVSEMERSPVAAQVVRGTGEASYVIPEVNGYTLDVEQTWIRLAHAAAGSRVEPAARVHTPTKRLADFPESIIRQGNPNKRAVALLINVDWGTDDLRQMLPILKERGAKATFFVSGRWADGNKRLLQLMASDGHEIATHGYDLQFGPSDLLRAGKLKADIARSVTSIEQITGTKVAYYAPHMSEVDPPGIVKTATELKLRTVLYSLDTVDWRESTTPEAILKIFDKAIAGDLILLHPKPNTAKVLGQALAGLEGKGLAPVTLTALLSPDSAVQPEAGK